LKLARLMGCTVDELDQRMSPEEFADHCADFRLIEKEAERDDIRTAALMEVIAQSQGGKLTREKAFNSIVPAKARIRPPVMTEQQLIGVLKMWG